MQYLLKKGDTTTRTQRITGYSGCEFNHTFETESEGGLEPIYLSSNNNGVVFQTKVNEGTIADPATPYVITITIGSAATVTGGPLDINLSTNTGVSGTSASISDGMTAEQVAAALRATTIEGYVVSGATNEVIVTSVATGNTIESIEINKPDEVFVENSVEVKGTYSGGGKKEIDIFVVDVSAIVAGSINVYFNSATPVEVALEGTESASDVYDLIVAATPETHTSVNFGGQAVVITNNSIQANAIANSIDAGETGIVVSNLHQDGADPTGTDPKSTSVDTEYTLDTIYNVKKGTALWTKIESIASGNTKQVVISHPVTAIRINVKEAATDSSAQVILRTNA